MKKRLRFLVLILMSAFVVLTAIQFLTVFKLPNNIARDIETPIEQIEERIHDDITLLYTIDSLQLISAILVMLSFFYIYKVKHADEDDIITIDNKKNIHSTNASNQDLDEHVKKYELSLLSSIDDISYTTHDLKSLCNQSASIIASTFNVSCLAIYILKETQLTYCGGYAYLQNKKGSGTISSEENIYSEVIDNHTPIYFTDVPNNTIKISSGLGEESPLLLGIVPLIHNDQVIGIMEIASFSTLDDDDKSLLLSSSKELGDAISQYL